MQKKSEINEISFASGVIPQELIDYANDFLNEHVVVFVKFYTMDGKMAINRIDGCMNKKKLLKLVELLEKLNDKYSEL